MSFQLKICLDLELGVIPRKRLVSALGHEEAIIDQPSEKATDKRPNPVDPVVGPDPSTSAGPKERAGFMDAPEKGPPASTLAPTTSPTRSGPMPPTARRGSTTVA